MIRPFGRDGLAAKLSRQADCEIANVDHFLNFAQTLGNDLADFDRDEATERVFLSAQFLAQQSDQFAAHGWFREPA
jgi:hypothetical protein